MDFNSLVGNHPRKSKDFYPLVPQLAEAKNAPGVEVAPLLAIQVTLFPDLGISIGFTNHHIVGDGASIVRFIQAWALLNKDKGFLADLPFYDRSVIKDSYGQLAMSTWDSMKEMKLQMSDIMTPPDQKVRSTFIIRLDDIVKLKNLIMSRRPSLAHVTSFTVKCGYVWTCLIKSESEMDENVMEFFLCAADYSARLNPPLPPSYFGNCLMGYIARTKHGNIAGKEGFTIAVELIGEAVHKRKKDDEEWILSGELSKEVSSIDWSRTISVAGSPRLDLYASDFGWGRPEKLDFVSIDSGDGISMSLSKSNGDLEVGLSLPKNRTDAFAAIFTHGLSFL